MPTIDASKGQSRAPRIAALVVTFFPDSGLPARLDRLLQQFERVVLVDNGSDEASLQPIASYERHAGVTLRRNASNLGIATALNQGLRILSAEGFRWAVTFDQDSIIRPGFVSSMLKTLESQQDADRIALVGATRTDADGNSVHRWLRPRSAPPFFERVPCDEASDGVSLVITSGALTSIPVFNRLGGFRDDLFIDLVDFEYCLRAREQGYKILVSCAAQLVHKVGDETRSRRMGLKISSTHHSPLRRYYLFRNSVHLIKRYSRIHPHWLIYHILSLCEVFAGILLIEREKGRKLHACVTGIVDGLSGKTGPSSRHWNHQ